MACATGGIGPLFGGGFSRRAGDRGRTRAAGAGGGGKRKGTAGARRSRLRLEGRAAAGGKRRDFAACTQLALRGGCAGRDDAAARNARRGPGNLARLAAARGRGDVAARRGCDRRKYQERRVRKERDPLRDTRRGRARYMSRVVV